jgi:hypothetical protein
MDVVGGGQIALPLIVRDSIAQTVSHPSHYVVGGYECKDVFKALVDGSRIDPWSTCLWFSAFQYIWRWTRKNGLDDLKKARLYLDWLIEHEEKESGECLKSRS